MKLLFIKLQHSVRLFRYVSVYKLFNVFKSIISYLLSTLKFQKLQDYHPLFISIETTDFCNLQCPECPVGRRIRTNPVKSSFDSAVLNKLLVELKPSLLHVILYFQGEPFLNNKLFELIKLTHDADIYTSTSTNGQFLNEDTARKLVLSGLDKLIVSIDGSTQQVYETYRVGGNLQKITDGISSLVACKKRMKSITPFIEIQFLVLKTNEHQMKDMQLLAKRLQVDRLTFKTAQLNDFENGNELLTSKKRFARYKQTKQGNFMLKGHQPNRCWRLWSGAVINVNGEVLPCCFDKSSEYSFGNVQNSSFLACWQGDKASRFRSMILKNRKQVDMCGNCTG